MKNPKFTHYTRTYSILITQITCRNADKHMHMHITHNNTAIWAHTSPTVTGTSCENTDGGHGTDTALHITQSSTTHTDTWMGTHRCHPGHTDIQHPHYSDQPQVC